MVEQGFPKDTGPGDKDRAPPRSVLDRPGTDAGLAGGAGPLLPGIALRGIQGEFPAGMAARFQASAGGHAVTDARGRVRPSHRVARGRDLERVTEAAAVRFI